MPQVPGKSGLGDFDPFPGEGFGEGSLAGEGATLKEAEELTLARGPVLSRHPATT